MRKFIISVAGAALLSGCTNLFLQPDRVRYVLPDRVGAKWEDVRFRTRDGATVTGWWFPARVGAQGVKHGVVVQFHGNGENMSSHFLYVYWLALHGWDVLAFDYRGYGETKGGKSLSGALADGVAAIQYARGREIARTPIVVIGQSLGGALAVAALDREGGDDVRALVLDSTFASYRGVAAARLRTTFLSPIARVLAWIFISDSIAPIRLIAKRQKIPLLMLHCDDDPIVPAEQGRLLFDAAPDPKTFWKVPGAGHAEALGAQGAEFRPRIEKFLEDAVQ